MKSSSSINEVYNLLSDILGMVGKYRPEVFREATQHVDLTAKGLDRDVLMKVFKELQRMTEVPSSELPASPETPKTPETPKKIAVSKKAAAPAKSPKKVPAPGKSSPKKAVNDSVVARIQEMRGIFGDVGFVPGKQELLKLIRKHFGDEVVIRANNKDSRRDIVSRALAVFRKMNGSQQDAIYSALKADYMKKPVGKKPAKGKKK